MYDDLSALRAERDRLKAECDTTADLVSQSRGARIKISEDFEALRAKHDQEDEERLKKIEIERVEVERIRKQEDDIYLVERQRITKEFDDEEAERLRMIKAANVELQNLQVKREAYKEQERLRKLQIQQDEDYQRQRLKKLAEEEADVLLKRLRIIESEEADRHEKVKQMKLQHKIDGEKLRWSHIPELMAEKSFYTTAGGSSFVRKSSLTSPRLSYTQKVRQIYRSPIVSRRTNLNISGLS